VPSVTDTHLDLILGSFSRGDYHANNSDGAKKHFGDFSDASNGLPSLSKWRREGIMGSYAHAQTPVCGRRYRPDDYFDDLWD
jgi:hypothetical protein